MSDVYAARRARLLERLTGVGADAALVVHPAGVRYLTGNAAPGAALLCTSRRAVLVVPSERFERPGPVERAAPSDPAASPEQGEQPHVSDVPDTSCALTVRALPPDDDSDPALVAAEELHAEGEADALTLAVEEHVLTVRRYRGLTGALPSSRLVDAGRAVEQLRLIKDDTELEELRVAAHLADQALGELLESILVGRTERHLALELERRMVDHGAEGTAFPVTVGTGVNSGLVRHRPTDRRVEEGDFLTVALGSVHHGYRCSTCRTFAIGTEPARWQIDLYEQVFAAQRGARERLGPGVSGHEVTETARQVLARAGYPDDLSEGVGHGVGLEIVEEPKIEARSMGKLDACVPVTVGLGIHLPGRGGVRLEDTLVVRAEADGGPELLTITTKELLAL